MPPAAPVPGRRGRKGLWIGLTAAGLILVLCGGIIGVKAYSKHQASKIDDDYYALTRSMETTLLAGDEAGWLSRVDPTDPELVKHFTGLYRELRALHITSFQIESSVPPIYVEDEGDSYRLRTRIYYCFANDACPRAADETTETLPYVMPEIEFTWQGGKYVITDTTLDTIGKGTSKPWGRGALTVADGRRVVVAASAAHASAVKRTAGIADAAATVADRFAKFTRVPKYYVYLASDEEWKAWNEGGGPALGDGVAAYAQGQGRFGYDIVVRMSKFANPRENLQHTLQHEFGHAVSLMGSDQVSLMYNSRNKVLIEGIAEYIGAAGASPLKSELLDLSRRYMRDNFFIDLDIPWPGPKDDSATISGAYGVGHFAVSCLASRYGEDKMFAYFDARVRKAQDVDQASEAVFGKPWGEVSTECAQWIRKTAGVKL